MNLATKVFLWTGLSAITLGIPLFLAAGTLAWLAGWVLLVFFVGFFLVGGLLLLKFNPGLLEERINVSPQNQKTWDKVFLGVFYLFFFVWLVLMAFDAVRFHWSQMSPVLQVIGAIALLVSFVLMGLVFRENSYLSPTVRIQQERGQTVVSTGPYHYVRHPLYASVLPLLFGMPLLLGSWYGVLLILLFMPLLMTRTVLEERTLRNELAGYDAYMKQVKYRLIPYVW